jgi:maltokinase
MTNTDDARGAVETLGELVSAYAARRLGLEGSEEVALVDTEVMEPGRPGIVDVVARAGANTLHVPIGLRVPGDEARFLPEADDPVLGLFDDGEGIAVATEAMRDSELAVLVLRAVTGTGADPALVRQIRMDRGSITLAMDDRLAFTVYTEVSAGSRLELEMLVALDDVGFNHIAAPVAIWRRGGMDLGVVQEYLPGASIGWSLALTSVRDLYASGGPPELAGGDFGPEARRLGTMTGRMHVALEEAFGRQDAEVSQWADAIEGVVRPLSPHTLDRPEVAELMAAVKAIEGPSHAIRTHGDFHLGRVFRTDQGWYVGDLAPGGRSSTRASVVARSSAESDRSPVFRSPLADVADMLWSFGYVAASAAEERDPTGREGLVELAHAWEERNREAFLSGYAEVAGIDKLLPVSAEEMRALASALELERAAVGFGESDPASTRQI